jgi:NTE family protein
MSKPITLVLGGTGVKGITSIGVLQSFHNHDIKIKKIISSGISSLISAQFAMGDDPDVLTERFIHFFEGNNRSIWGLEQASGLLMSPRTHLAGNLSYYLRERSYCHANFQNNSILAWESADPMINNLFDNKSFSDLKIPLAVSAIDIKQGKCVLIQEGKLKDAMRASIAYPGIFPPVSIGKMKLVSSNKFSELPLAGITGNDSPVLAVDLPNPFYGVKPQSLLEVIAIVDDLRCREIKDKLLAKTDIIFQLKGLKQFRWGDYKQIPLIVAHARKEADKFLKNNPLT